MKAYYTTFWAINESYHISQSRHLPIWSDDVINNPTSDRVIIFTLTMINSEFSFFFKEALKSVAEF